MTNLIEEIEKQQLRDDIPEFSSGDTVAVQVRVRESGRERLQIFEGIVIAKKKQRKKRGKVGNHNTGT